MQQILTSKNSQNEHNHQCHNTKNKLTVVWSLKSRHPPQIIRLTVAPLDTALILGRNSSTTLAIASRLSEVALSPVYLHRHSRHTRSNDMEPLARGTALVAIFWEKAVVRAKSGKRRARVAFIVVEGDFN
jgi:hypothetical protein